VVVDATAMPGLRAGAAAYVVELLRAVDPSEAELHVLVKESDAAELAAMIPKATVHPVRVGGRVSRIAWSHTLLARRAKRLRPDVFHGPHYTLPSGLRCPAVVTFHDPTFFSHPHLHERSKVAYFTRTARSGIARAARVIAISEYTRRGAVELAGADPDRVDVVLHGVDTERYSPAEQQRDHDPYVLFVGTLEPRKDVPSLIAAWDALDVPHELVLAGQRGWGTDAIDRAIAGARKKNLRVTGYVSEDEKVALYRGADAFVYPSIAEGFGLPVLEAMACGTPVVTTMGSAPEEVASGSALLVPPQDVTALRDALQRVLSDATLAADLRRRGVERAQGHTWTDTARKTVDVWRRAAEGDAA
jgi:glycosyltransferase involved in cell wall biosynthesis